MIPSKYQSTIYNAINTTKNNIIIQARAGSGKTTTLIECMKLLSGKSIFLAFNKSIATELSKRVPDHVECSTLHSAGLRILKQHLSNGLVIDTEKVTKIFEDFDKLKIYETDSATTKVLKYELRKDFKHLISLMKNLEVVIEDVNNIQQIADIFGINIDVDQDYKLIKSVFEKSRNNLNCVDFDDMIYLPNYLNLHTKYPYDNVLVDECQDLNVNQINLIFKLIKKSSRILTVGDPFQSIYRFRGADKEALNIVKKLTNATEYLLPISYRCPIDHIGLIKYIVNDIEPRDNAPNGIIENIKYEEFFDKIPKEKNPMIICRINSYMVPLALKMIAKGYPAKILGRDIGNSLISIVKKLKSKDMIDFYQKIDLWKLNEINKLNLRKIKPPQSAYDNIADKYDTLIIIANESKEVLEIINKLESIFSDNADNCFKFSTVHKCKGMEADTVVILAPHLLPFYRKNQTEDEKIQELNIKYVAYTRSKNKLIIVHDNE